MATDYGTGMGTGNKEQLSGYFDVNSEGVSIKEGRPTTNSWRFWTKKKKILVIGSIIFIVLLLVIIIIAASAKHKSSDRGIIESLKDGANCTGDKTKQNQCKSGECIEDIFVCDGLNDCLAGEDEIKNLCKAYSKKPPCVGKQFQCQVNRDCIDNEKRCNGIFDCSGKDDDDYSDERNCFTIDTGTSEVSVIKNGASHPMSAEVDNRECELICKQLGFKSLRYRPDRKPTDETILQCGKIDQKFDPEEEDINVNVDIVADCEGGTLALICEVDFCGVFGNYTGPPTPPSWVSTKMAEKMKASAIPFPWVVNIYEGSEHRCKGAIVDSEWVITSLNCMKKEIFYSILEEDEWSVVAADGSSFSQKRILTKVMRNHFELLNRTVSSDNIVAVQVFPPFDITAYAHPICLQQPALLPHYNCFSVGIDKSTNKEKHVRVVPLLNETACEGHNNRDEVACFRYPHSSDPSSCINAIGGPISCLDPATNSWTLGGVMSSNIGCDKDERLAPHMDDEPNYYWANVITSTPQEYGGKCEGRAQFREIRFQRGIREGEFYVDVSGWGKYQAWHTVYDVTSAFNLIIKRLDQGQFSPTVRIIKNNTGISSKKVAVLTCPKKARDMCSCKVKYKSYNPLMGEEAQSLHFIDDSNQDGQVDFEDYQSETWNGNNTLDELYDDYLDTENPDKIGLDDILNKTQVTQCPNIPDGRMCKDNSRCIREDMVCDSHSDCTDNSDEIRELCEKLYGYKCPPRWFRCRTTYDCVPWDSRCNGKGDCIDGSDERECVRVMEDKTVFVEKKGLSLPLSGLPASVSNESEVDLGINLCQAMGHGQFFKLNTTNTTGRDFGLGCYKLNTENYGNSYVVHKDFDKHDASECNSTLSISCGRPRCGTTATYQGPERPEDWPEDRGIKVTNTTNRDYPWVVHIKKGGAPVCSATIILPQWVITNFDCIDELSRDLTVEFTDTLTKQLVTHKITHKVNYFTTKTHPKTGEAIERNVVMLAIDPPFDLSSISHPLCLRAPLYVPQSYCQISGHDNTNTVKHIRVVTRNPEECVKAGVSLSNATSDHQCVEVIPDLDDSSTDIEGCLNTKGSSLQCVDGLRNQFSFTAVMTQDVGRGCTDEKNQRSNKLLAAATNMRPLLSWVTDIVEDVVDIQNVTCDDGVQALTFRQANYMGEWYITTDNGLAVKWDSIETLVTITDQLVEYFSAAKVTGTADSDGNNGVSLNITAIDTLSLSNCSSESVCTCAQSSTDAKAEGVMKFYIVGTDSELTPDREYQESDGVIYDPGNEYTTDAFEEITRSDERSTEEPSRSS